MYSRILTSVLGMTLMTNAIAQDAPKAEIGKKAPDFVMTNIDGKQVKLSEKLRQGKNVVLMFSRAHW